MAGVSKILIVDDEESLASFLSKLLQHDSPEYEIRVAFTGKDALKMLEGFSPDCVLQDIKLPDISGIEILKSAKALDPDIQVVMMTAFASLDTSLEAIKMGAYDYVVKPFKSEQIKTIIRNALSKRKLILENKKLLSELKEVNRELALANEKLKFDKAEVDKQLEKKIIVLSKLYEIAQALNQELNFQRLIAEIVGGTRELFNIRDVSLLLYEEEKSLVVRGKHGFDGILDIGLKLDSTHPFIKNLEKGSQKIHFMNYEEGEIKEVALGILKTERSNPMGVLILGKRDRKGELKKDSALLEIYLNTASIALHNAFLFDALERSYVEGLLALVKAEEAKDPAMKGHAARVANLAGKIGKKMGLRENELKTLRFAALLHDVGKIGIREYILEKPGELSSEEFETIKQHITIGLEILKPLKFLREAIPIIKYHHENYDGTGYPEARKGVEIPLGSRIISVCDVYDAVTSERAYSGKINKEQALNLILSEAGKKFDPNVVNIFIEVIKNE